MAFTDQPNNLMIFILLFSSKIWSTSFIKKRKLPYAWIFLFLIVIKSFVKVFLFRSPVSVTYCAVYILAWGIGARHAFANPNTMHGRSTKIAYPCRIRSRMTRRIHLQRWQRQCVKWSLFCRSIKFGYWPVALAIHDSSQRSCVDRKKFFVVDLNYWHAELQL